MDGAFGKKLAVGVRQPSAADGFDFCLGKELGDGRRKMEESRVWGQSRDFFLIIIYLIFFFFFTRKQLSYEPAPCNDRRVSLATLAISSVEMLGKGCAALRRNS